MYYREIAGVKVSALGMGNMRLPTIDGVEKNIDYEKAWEIIDYAMSHGVNYYDTGYRYHGGESERFLGKALEKYARDKYLLASKFPGHMVFKKENGVLGRTILWKAFSRSRWKSARWNTLISICCTMSTKSLLPFMTILNCRWWTL